MSSIPPEMEETPKGPSDDLDRGHRPHDYIRRHEFVSLVDDVKAIKFAVIGKNPMRPDPESLSMRVDDHDKAIKFAHKVSLAALIGMLGMLGKMAWAAMVGSGRP